jgi:putative ABC transport system permease protein
MEGALVNETALTTFGLGTPEEALNERIIIGGDTTEIVGVLKNYNWNSLKEEVSPWIFKADTISRRNFSIHLSGSNINESIHQIEAKYKELFPGNPFNYYFLDDFFDKQYKDEHQFASIFSMFSVLAIIIACLGLWGLASFNTTQRLKEISIRKVLGASVGSLVSLLSWQFFKLVIVASIVALPLSWYGIDQWLSGFAFRVGLKWDLFVVPVVALTVLSLGTVSFHIIKGTLVNPATTLRSE